MRAHEAFMSMLTVLSSTHRAHQNLVSMLRRLSCARAHEACVRTTTLGQSAPRMQDYIKYPFRTNLGALDLLYLGVTIENMCRRHYRAPGHHYQ